MAVVLITNEIQEAAREVHRRRLLSNTSKRTPDFRATIAETAFLSLYGKVPTVDDLKVGPKSLFLAPTDDAGNVVRVCTWERWPIRVFSRYLDAGAYVFAVPKGDHLEFEGWLPINLVEEAPIYWFEEDGERVDYSHEIDRDYLIPMPSTFRFVDTCEHKENWMQIWDWTFAAWQCCGCSRYVYDSREREHSARLLADHHRNSDQVLAHPRGAERT